MIERAAKDDATDKRFGFDKVSGGPERLGWLMNVQPTIFRDKETNQALSAVDLYFLQEDGDSPSFPLPLNLPLNTQSVYSYQTKCMLTCRKNSFEHSHCRFADSCCYLVCPGFKVTYPHMPYFLIRVKDGTEAECEQYVRHPCYAKFCV